jgi:hypothetical protein
MQKQKRKISEVVKVVFASLLSVVLFGAMLMGANGLAFANAASRTMELPPLEAMSVSLPDNIGASVAAALAATDSPRRNLNVNEIVIPSAGFGFFSNQEKSENTLSAEEAAQIGAQYIYEIFDECIDGATVQMTFQGHLRHRGTNGVWSGMVGDGTLPEGLGIDIEMPIGQPMFMFMLNAETGEAIHVERMTIGGDGTIILTPRSDAGITMDIPFSSENFERFSGDAEVRREIQFHPINPADDDWGIPWELPDNVIRIDDLEEWLRENNLNSSHSPSIIRRFTPATPIAPPQPQENSNENGNGRST